MLVLALSCFVLCCHNNIISENKGDDDFGASEPNFKVRTLFGSPKDPKVIVVLDLLICEVRPQILVPVTVLEGFS